MATFVRYEVDCHDGYQVVHVPEREVVWTPPKEGWVKLNFDGGLLRDKSSAISGGIFRDHRGVPLYSYVMTKYEGLGKTPYSGELGALYLGLRYAGIQGYKKLWIEGDAKFLIDVVEGRKANHWFDDDAVEGIREYLDSRAFDVRPKLTFIHREGNMAADAIVKELHDHPYNNESDKKGWEIDEALRNYPDAVIKVWKIDDEKFPVRVKKVTDWERQGKMYKRKACSYVEFLGRPRYIR